MSEAYPASNLMPSISTSSFVHSADNATSIRLALATLPDLSIRLYDLFLTNKTNSQGIYVIKLYVRGIPFVVSIDDTFLFAKDEVKP